MALIIFSCASPSSKQAETQGLSGGETADMVQDDAETGSQQKAVRSCAGRIGYIASNGTD